MRAKVLPTRFSRRRSKRSARPIRAYRVRFVERVWPGDVLTCGARVVKRYQEGGRELADVECWVTNQDGKTNMTGSATIGPA